MPGGNSRHTTCTNTLPSTSQCFHFGLVCPARSSRWSPSLCHMVRSSAVTTMCCGISIFSLVLVSRKRMGGYSHKALCKSTTIPVAFVSAFYLDCIFIFWTCYVAQHDCFPLELCFLLFLSSSVFYLKTNHWAVPINGQQFSMCYF